MSVCAKDPCFVFSLLKRLKKKVVEREGGGGGRQGGINAAVHVCLPFLCYYKFKSVSFWFYSQLLQLVNTVLCLVPFLSRLVIY